MDGIGTSHYQVLDVDTPVAVTVVDDRVSLELGGLYGLRLTMPLPVAQRVTARLDDLGLS